MSELIFNGYRIQQSRGHGKAVAGTKKTATIQVVQDIPGNGYLIKKQFVFRVGDLDSLSSALSNAVEWAKQYPSKEVGA